VVEPPERQPTSRLDPYVTLLPYEAREPRTQRANRVVSGLAGAVLAVVILVATLARGAGLPGFALAALCAASALHQLRAHRQLGTVITADAVTCTTMHGDITSWRRTEVPIRETVRFVTTNHNGFARPVLVRATGAPIPVTVPHSRGLFTNRAALEQTVEQLNTALRAARREHGLDPTLPVLPPPPSRPAPPHTTASSASPVTLRSFWATLISVEWWRGEDDPVGGRGGRRMVGAHPGGLS
jgi:hypothetical protein